MDITTSTQPALTTRVPDVRRVPLKQLTGAARDETARPLADFNSSI